MKKRLVKFVVSKTDLLGADESRGGGLFSAKRTPGQLTKVFALGQRHSVLTDAEKDYIIYRVAQASGQRFPFERVYRSAQRVLVSSYMPMFCRRDLYLCCCCFGTRCVCDCWSK